MEHACTHVFLMGVHGMQGVLKERIWGYRSMPDKSIVLLFIKVPATGRVKTRLASHIGDEAALELYRNFILDIIDTVNRTGYPMRICFYPADGAEAAAHWLGRQYEFVPQDGNDLGVRMKNAFRRVFSEGWRSAVLIGSDIPDLPVKLIVESLESLKRNDVVIGPAADGGYNRIGFNDRAFLPRVFRRIPWSTEKVLEKTMTILQDAALMVHVALRWNDVDTVEDLKDLLTRNNGTEFGNSRTMEFIRKNQSLFDNVVKLQKKSGSSPF